KNTGTSLAPAPAALGAAPRQIAIPAKLCTARLKEGPANSLKTNEDLSRNARRSRARAMVNGDARRSPWCCNEADLLAAATGAKFERRVGPAERGRADGEHAQLIALHIEQHDGIVARQVDKLAFTRSVDDEAAIDRRAVVDDRAQHDVLVALA